MSFFKIKMSNTLTSSKASKTDAPAIAVEVAKKIHLGATIRDLARFYAALPEGTLKVNVLKKLQDYFDLTGIKLDVDEIKNFSDGKTESRAAEELETILKSYEDPAFEYLPQEEIYEKALQQLIIFYKFQAAMIEEKYGDVGSKATIDVNFANEHAMVKAAQAEGMAPK